ncbi:MAG: putative oxidoreductase [Actinomycetia bacterium]|nr:putative oxidoreductase [Actinomycetes bacterium]
MSDEVPIDEELTYRVENAVGWITINRPNAGNAITPAVRNRMIERLDEASASYEVRAVVITAAGEKHFCTGADLRAGRAAPAPKPEGTPDSVLGDAHRMIATGIQRLAAAIQDCSKPVIVALNGTAAGGGAMIALAADMIVAADTARIIQVFVRRGIIPDGGVAYFLPRLIGLHKAKELVFFGDDLPAADAERLGIVNKVVPAAELEATAKEWAERLAQGPTKAIGISKAMLNQSPDVDRATAFSTEAWFVELNTRTEDSTEGMMSFVERRPSAFKGW